MSTKDEPVSDKALEEPKNDSVFDFLYHDVRRIGSFLSQFDDAGHLQQITQSETASKRVRRGYKISLGGGATVLGTGGSGNVGFERGPQEQGSEESHRVYDPLWANSLLLLDYLESANLLGRDVTAAHIGQFVLVSGQLSVLNAGLLPKLWESAHIKSQVISAWKKTQKAIWDADPAAQNLSRKDKEIGERQFLKNAETNANAALDILPSFPHSA
jgi:hypothetical protein